MDIDELISIIEKNEVDLNIIKNMVGLLWDLHVLNINALKDSKIRETYSTSQTLVESLFELILYKEKEYHQNIDKIYECRKSIK